MSESISDKIASILSAAPATIDPEDDVHEETTARVETGDADDVNDDEQLLSSFRKQNVDLLEDVDKRYEGKKGSRKKLLGLDEWESEDDDDAQDSKAQESDEEEEDDAEDDDEKDEEESVTNSEDDQDSGEFNIEDESFKHLKSSDTSSQVQKGLCVRQQLNMWESLLEFRIQMQKCLLAANKLPQTAVFNDLKEKCGNEFVTKAAESKGHVTNLLDKLLYLQLLLLKNYPETKNLLTESNKNVKDKAESDEEIPSDTEDEQSNAESNDLSDEEKEEVPRKRLKIGHYTEEINKRHSKYTDYRNSVIQKWNDKTRVGAKSENITANLVMDKEKRIKKTQLKRSDYEILGENRKNDTQEENDSAALEDSEEYNENIFDDTDFYHHLLRELIEFKSNDLTDPVQLGRQWIQLQNLRSKMKRKIDTRATKGRKIRYVVHTKLVNFMAPIEEGTWQEEAKSELFNSLFGKNQPVNTI